MWAGRGRSTLVQKIRIRSLKVSVRCQTRVGVMGMCLSMGVCLSLGMRLSMGMGVDVGVRVMVGVGGHGVSVLEQWGLLGKRRGTSAELRRVRVRVRVRVRSWQG